MAHLIDPETVKPMIFATIGAILGLGSSFLTILFKEWRDGRSSKRSYIERQLREFYQPMLAVRAEVAGKVVAFTNADSSLSGYNKKILLSGIKEHLALLLERFREKFGLAEKPTRDYFSQLVRLNAGLELEVLDQSMLYMGSDVIDNQLPNFLKKFREDLRTHSERLSAQLGIPSEKKSKLTEQIKK